MNKQLFLLIMILLPLVANADVVEIDGIWYELIPKGNAAIVTYNPDNKVKYTGDIVIPEKIRYDEVDYDVKYIKEFAFINCYGLHSVRIPGSVTIIESSTFMDCISLKTIYLPRSITEIKKHAFYGCVKLKSVYIDDLYSWCSIQFDDGGANPLCYDASLYLEGKEVKNLVFPTDIEYVNDYAFYGCNSITSVTIPEGVKGIRSDAFSSCRSLQIVQLPNSLEWIGTQCFRFDVSITSISLPDNISYIGPGAFSQCSSITELSIPANLKEIGEYPFTGMKGLRTLIIPDNVEKVGEMAFSDCSNLKSLTISKNVTRIGKKAFANCSGMLEVICRSTTPPSAFNDTFQECYPEYIKLYVPKGCVNSYKGVSPWNHFGTIKEYEETGFEDVSYYESDQVRMFNIDGKAQNMLQKGINIVNGKKILIKSERRQGR